MSAATTYPLVDLDLVVVEFRDDLELLSFLRLPDDALSRRIIADYSPEHRYQLARMRAIADELNAGRIPRCVRARAASSRRVRAS